MENDILTNIKTTLQTDADIKAAGVKSHAIIISENGEITAGTPMPAIAIASGSIETTPRDMTGRSDFIRFQVIIHVYMEDFSKAQRGPDTPSLNLKTLCNLAKAALRNNTLTLNLLDAQIGSITFPNYAQRNYIDRWEGRVPVNYRWVHINT